ncbi:MAG: hypothetical protein AB7K71_15710 [Polyangiaceae bacterium]
MDLEDLLEPLVSKTREAQRLAEEAREAAVAQAQAERDIVGQLEAAEALHLERFERLRKGIGALGLGDLVTSYVLPLSAKVKITTDSEHTGTVGKSLTVVTPDGTFQLVSLRATSPSLLSVVCWSRGGPYFKVSALEPKNVTPEQADADVSKAFRDALDG